MYYYVPPIFLDNAAFLLCLFSAKNYLLGPLTVKSFELFDDIIRKKIICHARFLLGKCIVLLQIVGVADTSHNSVGNTDFCQSFGS